MKPRRNAMLSCGLWNNSNNNCRIYNTGELQPALRRGMPLKAFAEVAG